ncbi:hypothetical protein C0Q70_01449 [Pomacea canaliculata]|uniref:AD domain-containing protein n=1 Tax=Pomacea canaliculata TaxID=400727 RepID=A0A2T7PZH2_POMCA|nr:gem-associated protein 6-like [Pomacea canaliculata]PVD38825.1 hypothetical protein C0Q70_01449 [Pomacea canaliculata]
MEVENSSETHPIFLRDPDEWLQYVYKHVSVVTEDDDEHVGWLYTVDPVSESFVLVHFLEENVQLSILLGSSITKVTVLADAGVGVKEKLDALFRPKAEAEISEDELKARKQKLKMWLEKNRLPVQLTGDNSEILSISDALIIQPPYGENNCHSMNEIILGRIQGLIKSMPEDHDKW